MATAVIQIDGVTGNNTNLSPGVIPLQDVGVGGSSWSWELISAPPDSGLSAGVFATTQTTSITLDVRGSYLIKLTVDSTEVDQKIAAIRTTNSNLRVPAIGEQDEYGTAVGWAKAFYDLFDATDAAGLVIGDGHIILPEQALNPSNEADKGKVYSRDSDGYSEFYYMDNYGNVIQITNKGALADGYAVREHTDETDPAVAAGTETSLSLSAIPLIQVDMDSGYALDAFLNGARMRYVGTLGSDPTEFTYNAGLNRIEFVATGSPGDWHLARYKIGADLTPADGYSIVEYTDEIDPSGAAGTETSLSLTTYPIPQSGMASGYALEMFLNGVKMRYVGSLGSDPNEWTYNVSLNRTEFVATGIANSWHVAVYKTNVGIAAVAPTLNGAYDGSGSGAGRTITADSGPVRINASGDEALSMDGYIGFDSIADPSGVSGRGMLYVKDVDGYDELHYVDGYGSPLQMTDDGYSYVVLKSPNGTAWKLTVDNAGSLTAVEL